MRTKAIPKLLCILLVSVCIQPLYAEGFSHAGFDEILQTYVHPKGQQSDVDYGGLKKDRAGLDAYIKQVGAVSETDFKSWDPYDQLAFLINAYNAFTLQLVITHYPVVSIKDIGTDEKSVWKREIFQLFGRKISLDYLENEFIRKRYNEERVHFALVCAAVSCPPLRTEAYVGKRLNYHLEEQRAKFIMDKERNYIDETSKTLYLSKVFSWFSADFENSFKPTKRPTKFYVLQTIFGTKNMPQENYTVEFLPYDWALNDIKIGK